MAPDPPDYGPRGYLPPRAAKRARKIILREPMGLQWAIAAVVAGVVVLAAGGLLLLRSTPPGPPFVAVGEISQIDPRAAGVVALDDDRDVLVLRGAGGVTVFHAPAVPVGWCGERSRLIAASGDAAWEPDGRLVGGAGDSLARLPSQVYQGVLYVDAAAEGTRLDAQPGAESTTCTP